MSWINDLVETYDNVQEKVGIADDKGKTLLPISHVKVNAPIHITINKNGDFLRAQYTPKESNETIIPATIESSNRTGTAIYPMPLNDKLQYVAGDYWMEFENRSKYHKYFEKYLEQLHDWCESEFSNDRIMAIYQYLVKETVISDLKNSKLNIDYRKNEFVKFEVLGCLGSDETRTWQDLDLYKSWINYYSDKLHNGKEETKLEREIDFITGMIEPISMVFPAKIRNSGDKAKIISSNDEYKFQGRFFKATDAVTLGYYPVQKAFNVLQWLIARQGYSNGSERIVCWSSTGQPIPDAFDERLNLFGTENIDKDIDTAESYANSFASALSGYNKNLKPNDSITIISLDTADGSYQGRLAITYYNRLSYSRYLQNINKWYTAGVIKLNKKQKEWSGIPSLEEIVSSAYGIDEGGYLKVQNSNLQKKTIDRLLPCIVQGTNFPKDIMLSSVRNCSNPIRFLKKGETVWEKLLINTCIQIKKVHLEEGRNEIKMDSIKDIHDRSFLFGMLLAIADKIEQSANYQSGSDRITNAKHYWSTYTKYPAKTWMTLYERLMPYFEKIKSGSRHFYDKKIEEIMLQLEKCNDFTNFPLNENYLLGYYYQKNSLDTYSKEEK